MHTQVKIFVRFMVILFSSMQGKGLPLNDQMLSNRKGWQPVALD